MFTVEWRDEKEASGVTCMWKNTELVVTLFSVLEEAGESDQCVVEESGRDVVCWRDKCRLEVREN